MRASFVSIRFKQFGHFHVFGPVGGFVPFDLLLAGFFGRSCWRLTLHSAHNPEPMLKPFIDFRDLQPTQYCVFSRPLKLPMAGDDSQASQFAGAINRKCRLALCIQRGLVDDRQESLAQARISSTTFLIEGSSTPFTSSEWTSSRTPVAVSGNP